jgi:hypothetical protein
MKLFCGTRTPSGTEIMVIDTASCFGRYPLNPDAGQPAFEWGDKRDGGTALAIAILADVVGEQQAKKHAADFKRAVVSRLPKEGFELSEDDVKQIVHGIENGKER